MKAECPNRIITSVEENGYDKIIKFFSEGHFRRRYSSDQKNRKNVDSKYQSDVGWLQRLSCKLVRLIRTPHSGHNGELSDQSMADFEHVTMPNWLIGAGCRLNRSMGFLMMDKRFGLHFMQKWGLQEAHLDRDAVAIVDREAERIFWMKDANISKETLAESVNGYFNNTLVWSVKDQNLSRPVITPNEADEQWFQSSVLNRLNRTGFLVEILNKNRAHDAVVFFSGGGWHGPSTSVMHYFHQTQRYFSDFGDLIKFYSIDVSQNTLPWKFHFNRLPTVAFFPAKSDQDSFSIQDGLAFNVPNLLGLILPRCQQRLRWLLAFSACKGMCLERNRRRIGEIVRRTEEDIRTLRRMQRERGGGNLNVGGSRHLRFLLRRRHLQKKVLSHLLGLVQSLQININDGDVHQLGRGIAEQAIFANWLLTAKLGLHFPIA